MAHHQWAQPNTLSLSLLQSGYGSPHKRGRWHNRQVPISPSPRLPGDLMSLISLGFNPVKLAILVELARRPNAQATTGELVTALSRDDEAPLHRMTITRNLNDLKAQGYVHTLEEPRARVRTVWVLNFQLLHVDLMNLIRHTTPRGD